MSLNNPNWKSQVFVNFFFITGALHQLHQVKKDEWTQEYFTATYPQLNKMVRGPATTKGKINLDTETNSGLRNIGADPMEVDTAIVLSAVEGAGPQSFTRDLHRVAIDSRIMSCNFNRAGNFFIVNDWDAFLSLLFKTSCGTTLRTRCRVGF